MVVVSGVVALDAVVVEGKVVKTVVVGASGELVLGISRIVALDDDDGEDDNGGDVLVVVVAR